MSEDENRQGTVYAQFLRDRDLYIAAHAHRYWLLRGCPEGSPESDWFRAEREFDQEFLGQLELGIPA
jgi:Protein of unknown function (DUF2934)